MTEEADMGGMGLTSPELGREYVGGRDREWETLAPEVGQVLEVSLEESSIATSSEAWMAVLVTARGVAEDGGMAITGPILGRKSVDLETHSFEKERCQFIFAGPRPAVSILLGTIFM